MTSEKIFAIEPKVVSKIRKTCVNQRDLMDFVLNNHYKSIVEIDEYTKGLICEMHSMNCKLIESIDRLLRDCPEVQREEKGKKELIMQDTQLLILETALMARAELSKILLQHCNVSTHSH